MTRRRTHNAWFEKYEVQFQRVFKVPEVLENFAIYLKKCLVEESLLFILAVEEYRTSSPTIEKMRDIHGKFIKSSGTHEINIPGSNKEKIEQVISQYDNKSAIEPDLTVFNEVYDSVLRDLRGDVFPRYIRTNNFKTFILSKGENFYKEIAIDVSTFNRCDLLIRPSDFDSKYITKQDVDFIKQMLQDSNDWITMSKAVKKGEISDHYAYISRTSYSMNDRLRKLGITKFTGVLPVSAKEFLPAFLDRDMAKIWDKNMESDVLLEHLPASNSPDQPYSCVLANYTVKKMPIIKRRRMQVVLTLLYDDSSRSYLWVGKSTTAYPFPETSEPTCWMAGIYAYVLHEVNDTSCKYTHICYLDSGLPMKLEEMFQNKSYAIRAKGIQEGLLKICKAYVGRSDKPKNDLGSFSNLNDYLTKNNITVH
jgi:hypothetical protein